MATLRVFTSRSTGIGIAGGVLVAGALGPFVGAAWGLVVLNGLAAGALALAGSVSMRHGRFGFLLDKAHERQLGVGMLTHVAMVPPIFFVDEAIGIELFNQGDGLALSLLFGFTASAAYFLGGILVMLAYLDGEDATADLRLHRGVLPLHRGGLPPGGRGPMNALRVFTARSTGIGMATGVLVGIAFGQLLGAAWGLAVLNGLAAGALALALSIDELRGGWWDTTHDRRRPGIRALAYAVMLAPALFAHRYIAFRPADEVAVSLLFMLTGFAAYTLGGIMATLVYLDDEPAAADPRLRRFTPPPGERHGS